MAYSVHGPTRPPQDQSSNLCKNENAQFDEYFTRKNCILLSITVAQVSLFRELVQSELSFSPMPTGVLCFIKDFKRDAYFICLFEFNTTLLWEQEVNTEFLCQDYEKPSETHHQLKFDNGLALFNFSNSSEACKFYSAVMVMVKNKTRPTLLSMRAKITRALSDDRNNADKSESGRNEFTRGPVRGITKAASYQAQSSAEDINFNNGCKMRKIIHPFRQDTPDVYSFNSKNPVYASILSIDLNELETLTTPESVEFSVNAQNKEQVLENV